MRCKILRSTEVAWQVFKEALTENALLVTWNHFGGKLVPAHWIWMATGPSVIVPFFVCCKHLVYWDVQCNNGQTYANVGKNMQISTEIDGKNAKLCKKNSPRFAYKTLVLLKNRSKLTFQPMKVCSKWVFLEVTWVAFEVFVEVSFVSTWFFQSFAPFWAIFRPLFTVSTVFFAIFWFLWGDFLPCLGRFGVIYGSLCDHFGVVFASFWRRFGVVLTTFFGGRFGAKLCKRMLFFVANFCRNQRIFPKKVQMHALLSVFKHFYEIMHCFFSHFCPFRPFWPILGSFR